MPAYALEIPPALPAMTVTSLVHAAHAVPPLTGTAGADGVTPSRPDTRRRRWPLWREALAQPLRLEDQRGGLRLSDAVRALHWSTPIPPPGPGLAPPRLRHGRRQWRRPPVHVVQRPHRTHTSSHVPPGVACQRAPRVGALRRRPRPSLARPLGSPEGPGRRAPGPGLLGLLGVGNDTRGLMPCRSGSSRRCPRSDAVPWSLGHLLVRLRRRLEACGRPGPAPPYPPRPLACGVPDLEATWDRVTRGLFQGRRGGRARCMPPLHPACQACAGVRPHALHVGPRLAHGAPWLPRAVRTARPRHPRPAVRFHRHKHRGVRQDHRLQASQHHQGLTGLIQPGHNPPGTRRGLGHPAAHGSTTRHPTLGHEDGTPRDHLRQAHSHRRAGGRTCRWFGLRECVGGGPHRPQRLRRSAPALRLGAALVVAGATRWRTRHGLLDAAARLVDRFTAPAARLGARRNRAPAPAHNRRGMAHPRCHRATHQGGEPRVLALGNTPPPCDSLQSSVRNCPPEFCKNTVPGDNAERRIQDCWRASSSCAAIP